MFVFLEGIKGLVAKEIVVVCQCESEKLKFSIKRVDKISTAKVDILSIIFGPFDKGNDSSKEACPFCGFGQGPATLQAEYR